MAQWLRRVFQLREMYSPLRPLMAQWLRRVSQLCEMYTLHSILQAVVGT